MVRSGLDSDGGEDVGEKFSSFCGVSGESAMLYEEFIVMVVLVGGVAALQAVVPGGVGSVWRWLPGGLPCLGANWTP